MAAHTEERLKISVAQKKDIRQYYKVQSPRVGHKHIREWFYDKYGIQLPFSTISNILSPKFDHLDQLSSNRDEAKRCRPPKYPDLEIALTECISRMKAFGMELTGAVLLKTAHELWPNIPAYRGQPVPSLSGGWVEKFKTRHKIKLRSLQSKSPSTRGKLELDSPLIPVTPDPEANDVNPQNDLDSIRSQTRNYSRDDIFSATEIELNWNLPPNSAKLRELSLLSRSENKSRITIALACNASGTHRLPPWIVGHYNTPRAFSVPGNDFHSINCMYSSNSIAWMTVAEWRNWIKWFDTTIDRRVLLILNPHRGHEIAYSTLADTMSLQNTEIVFLPDSSSPINQPMELGLVQSFKALYRKSYLTFISEFYLQHPLQPLLPKPILTESQELFTTANQDAINNGVRNFDQAVDPYLAVNLYIAAYWIQKAWLEELDSTQVSQAWTRSTLLGMSDTLAMFNTSSSPTLADLINPGIIREGDRLADLIRNYPASLSFMGNNNEALPSDYYFYPPEELVLESSEDFIELCTAQFHESDMELTDMPIYVVPPTTSSDAQKAIKLLISFEEQYSQSNMRYLQFLTEYKEQLLHRSLQKANSHGGVSPITARRISQSSLAPVSPTNTIGMRNQLSVASATSMAIPQTPVSSMSSHKRSASSQDSRPGRNNSLTLSRNNSNSSVVSPSNNRGVNYFSTSPTDIHPALRNSGNQTNNPLSLPTFTSTNLSGPNLSAANSEIINSGAANMRSNPTNTMLSSGNMQFPHPTHTDPTSAVPPIQYSSSLNPMTSFSFLGSHPPPSNTTIGLSMANAASSSSYSPYIYSNSPVSLSRQGPPSLQQSPTVNVSSSTTQPGGTYSPNTTNANYPYFTSSASSLYYPPNSS